MHLETEGKVQNPKSRALGELLHAPNRSSSCTARFPVLPCVDFINFCFEMKLIAFTGGVKRCVMFLRDVSAMFFSFLQGLGGQAEPQGGTIPSPQPLSWRAQPSERSR